MREVSRDLSQALAGITSGRWRVRIPRQEELFCRRPRAHFHATPEVFIQTGGATDFECPRDRFRLRTWEICVMAAGVPHAETPVDMRTPYAVTVCMQSPDGSVIHRARANERREIMAMDAERIVSARARAAFRYLDDLASSPVCPVNRAPLVSSLLAAFFLTLLDELARPQVEQNVYSPLVNEAEKLARSLLSDPNLSIARLAKALGVSSDHLSRCFHREHGRTLVSWITGERVALARSLLSDNRCNVSEVGWACGFTSPSYFIRVFRQHTGMTPRHYRLLHG